MTEEEKRTKAWIGDAVLALFAREWILKQTDIDDERTRRGLHPDNLEPIPSLSR